MFLVLISSQYKLKFSITILKNYDQFVSCKSSMFLKVYYCTVYEFVFCTVQPTALTFIIYLTICILVDDRRIYILNDMSNVRRPYFIQYLIPSSLFNDSIKCILYKTIYKQH